MNNPENKEEIFKKNATFGSGIALTATGIAAFTTALPAMTGVCVTAGLLGSGYAAFNYYKSLQAGQKSDQDESEKNGNSQN